MEGKYMVYQWKKNTWVHNMYSFGKRVHRGNKDRITKTPYIKNHTNSPSLLSINRQHTSFSSKHNSQ